jgi:hypothetical protein
VKGAFIMNRRPKSNDALHAQLCRVLRKLDARQAVLNRRKAQVWRAYKRNFKRALRAA